MVGGDFTGAAGEYSRKLAGVNLYDFKYSVENGNEVYILDFTQTDIGKGGIMSKFVGAASGPKKYSDILKEALKCEGEHDNAVIAGIVYALFDEGNSKAATRKIKITQDPTKQTKIELLSANDDVIVSGNVTAQAFMSELFKTLGNDVTLKL